MESRKYGSFFLNKLTGETFLPPYPGAQPPTTAPPDPQGEEENEEREKRQRGGREETDGGRRVRRRSVRHSNSFFGSGRGVLYTSITEKTSHKIIELSHDKLKTSSEHLIVQF